MTANADTVSDLAQDCPAYGTRAAALLQAFASSLLALVEGWVESLYAGLPGGDGYGALLTALGPDDGAAYRRRQAEHQRLLLTPDTSGEAADASSRQLGRVHAMTGVRVAWLVEAYGAWRSILRQARTGDATQGCPAMTEAAGDLIEQRMARDLHVQIQAHEEVEQRLAEALSRVDDLLLQDLPPPDLIAGALDILVRLDGMVAATLGRPDADGEFQFEVVRGAGFERYVEHAAKGHAAPISIRADDPTGGGASGRAWRSGQVQHTAAYATDPAIDPWRNDARELGIRSAVAIPLLDADRQPVALVDLYAEWPGYFSTPARRTLLTHLQRALSHALSRSVASTRVIPYETRRLYRQWLDAGALEMHFQPVVALRSGKVAKFEALARLREPESGRLVGPAEFLPAFDARQLLLLFERGLEQALAALRMWRQQGLDVGVSINLPPHGLSDPAYVQAVQTQLHATDVPPGRLTLELLESGELSEAALREPLMARLHNLGVLLAEDDLGAGYSSLLRLDSIAFNEVKIDQGLVRRSAFAPQKALDFIRHLARLSQDLNIPVTVEGLETLGLIEAAAILGADFGQGWGIARAMPAAEVPAWSRRYVLELDPEHPRTALGSYAAYLLWEAQLAALTPWPDLLERFVQVPSGLGNYLLSQDLLGSALDSARQLVLSAATQGPASQAYRHARQKLRILLAAHVRQANGFPTG